MTTAAAVIDAIPKMEAEAPHALPLCGHHFLRREKILLKMRRHTEIQRVNLLGLYM